LTYSGWLTHISGHPPAASRAQDSERTPAKDRCSTAGLRNQSMHNTPRLAHRMLNDLKHNYTHIQTRLIKSIGSVFSDVGYRPTRTHVNGA